MTIRLTSASAAHKKARSYRKKAVRKALRLSIITPAYNEASNLPRLYEGLCKSLDNDGIEWEWIVVDDHSSDETFSCIESLAGKGGRVQGIRLARNFGSHIAITCGLEAARGDCAVVMAADLQDQPEVIPELIKTWRSGPLVVWAVRGRREGEKASTLGFSRLYYYLMRRVVGIKEIPERGSDFFLMDRKVVDAFVGFGEKNASILALIAWMGFPQGAVTYTKQARAHGRSGWNWDKKFKLLIDSITSFTFLPIRLMSYTGIIMGLTGLLYACVVVANALAGHPVQGWSSLMVAVLVIGGVQMLMMGVLGEYLWRTLDESRRRPKYWIEANSGKPWEGNLKS